MKEYTGNIWELNRKAQDANRPPPLLFITTNGQIKKNGLAVMGKGIAGEAKALFRGVDKALAEAITARGNLVSYLGTWSIDDYDYRLFSFPTKNHWRENASLDLIDLGMQYAHGLSIKIPNTYLLIPRPGVLNGNLDWDTEVLPIVEKYATDNMIFVSMKKE